MDLPPPPPAGVQQPVPVGHGEGGQQRQDAHLGRHAQSHQRPQQDRVTQSPSLHQPQHPPQAQQDKADRESLRAVEVAVLDVDDRHRRQPGGQQSHLPAEHPPSQHVHQEHAAQVGQRGQGAARKPQVQGANVGEGFHRQPDSRQDIDQAAAQRKPVGIQGAAVRVQQNGYAGKPRLGLRMVRQAGCVSGRLREQVVHAARPQVEGPLIRVEPVPRVPINPMEPQHRRHRQNRQQSQTGNRGPVSPSPTGQGRKC